ncbi:MAG: VWA domain-containing protein [Bacteroidota bacterium]
MKRTYCLLIGLMLLSTSLFGQDYSILKVRVVDAEEKDPLQFATVWLPEKSVGGRTDSTGRVSIQFPFTKDSVLVRVSYPTSKKQVKLLPDGPEITIRLEFSYSVHNEVVITERNKRYLRKLERERARAKSKSEVEVEIRGARANLKKLRAAEYKKESESIRRDEPASTTTAKPTYDYRTSDAIEEAPPAEPADDYFDDGVYDEDWGEADEIAEGAGSPEIQAGLLTAGEIHDFSKWNLWQDLAATELNHWQNTWKVFPKNRYAVQVQTESGQPVPDAQVTLLTARGAILWESRTDNTGKAELWSGMYDTLQIATKLYVEVNGQSKEMNAPKVFQEGINHVSIAMDCYQPVAMDVAFVVDATGSMSDEIEYLKVELRDIIGKVQATQPDLDLQMGSVFYRDTKDDYLTRHTPMSSNIDQTIAFIKRQYAGGGGDTPEAVDAALEVAIDSLEWRPEALSRLLFLMLDAPPHKNPEVMAKLQRLIPLAAQKGIRIIPVTGSGIDKGTEYLMRCMALATNGTYVFLTDHSGIGGSHIEPSTDEYKVETLNELLIRLFFQYTFLPDCNSQPTAMAQDTAEVVVITVADSSQTDTLSGDSLQVNTSVSDSLQVSSWKYYPNPTTGPLEVEIQGAQGELFLADVSGKLLERFAFTENQQLHLNLSNYPSGTYFLQYIDPATERLHSGKVILMR